MVYWIGVGTFALCVSILLFGKRIGRTLELLNWVLVTVIIGGFLILALVFVSADTWVAAGAGLVGYDPAAGAFRFIPEGVDWFLIGAFAAYSGAGGVINLTLSNWARDKGYGMGERAGHIPAAVGGERSDLAPTGYTFDSTPQAMDRWRGWWRVVRVDQWGVYFLGAMLGMILPAVLYVTFIEGGTDIRGLSVAAALANAMASQAGAIFGGVIALLGVWVLFKTQLDIIEAMTRSITDILWTGSGWVRRLRGGDIRFVYYTVLGLLAVWGIVALKLAQPIFLLQLGANMAGIVFVISSLHLLYINTRFLPEAVRPPMWRRIALVAMSVFYGAFVVMWLRGQFGG